MRVRMMHRVHGPQQRRMFEPVTPVTDEIADKKNDQQHHRNGQASPMGRGQQKQAVVFQEPLHVGQDHSHNRRADHDVEGQDFQVQLGFWDRVFHRFDPARTL